MQFVDDTHVYVDKIDYGVFLTSIYLFLHMHLIVEYVQKLAEKRFFRHVAFWVIVLLILTILYSAGMPGYFITLGIISMFLPIHIFYFYTVAYLIIPKYFHKKTYLQFFILLILSVVVSTFAFRLLEILIADPLLYRAVKMKDPTIVWHKLEGTFEEQLKNPRYLISAFEQTNIFVWIALSIKFFKMWFERRQAAMEAELNFLKGQLHPHFLFNTLNNLYALTLNQSPRSPSVVMGLSEILRYMLYEANTDVVDLEKDLKIVQSYIELEKIRYEERLDIHFSINGILSSCCIAPLLILPLVENAFKHGVSEQIGQVWINIDLAVKSNFLKFKISNSKPEISITKKEQNRHHGSIGLGNVRKRLEILYPSAHQFRVLEEEEMFAVILELELDKLVKI